MASAQALTDHDEIRRWAEERGAQPASVKGTGRQRGDTGMIRLDFPGYSGAGRLEPISWDEWFRQFDENNLALLVQDTTSRGQASNFNKLVSRNSANTRAGGRSAASSGSRSRKASAARSRKKTASTRASGRGQKRTAGRSQKRASSRSRKGASQGGARKRASSTRSRSTGSRKSARTSSRRSARTR